MIEYQGDLVEATLSNESIGDPTAPGLLFINYKSPDYTGHVYGMFDPMTGDALRDVDAQLERLVAQLDSLYPGRYALIVTADHGQCPLPTPPEGSPRSDPALGRHRAGVRRGLFGFVQNVVPSEVYLHADVLWDAGASRRTSRRSSGTTRIAGTSDRTCRGTRSSSAPGSPAVRRRLRDDVPRLAPRSRPLVVRAGIYPEGEIGIPDRSRAEMDVELDDADRALLDGERARAALAMRLVVRLAEVARAPRLRDVTGAHIDSWTTVGRGWTSPSGSWPAGPRCPSRRR